MSILGLDGPEGPSYKKRLFANADQLQVIFDLCLYAGD